MKKPFSNKYEQGLHENFSLGFDNSIFSFVQPIVNKLKVFTDPND